MQCKILPEGKNLVFFNSDIISSCFNVQRFKIGPALKESAVAMKNLQLNP